MYLPCGQCVLVSCTETVVLYVPSVQCMCAYSTMLVVCSCVFVDEHSRMLRTPICFVLV